MYPNVSSYLIWKTHYRLEDYGYIYSITQKQLTMNWITLARLIIKSKKNPLLRKLLIPAFTVLLVYNLIAATAVMVYLVTFGKRATG